MAYQYVPNTWSSYDDTKTREENKINGAVITKDRLNHIEEGIKNLSIELSESLEEDTDKIPISISATKIKTSYIQSEKFDIDDLTVICNYIDGTSKEIKNYTTNIEDIDTNYGGTKVLKISYNCNGKILTDCVIINIDFNDSVNSIQYAFKLSKAGILKQSNILASCSSKIIRYSKLRLRIKLYVYIDFNSSNTDCKISCGNDILWNQKDIFGSITVPARQTGMFTIDIDKTIEFDNTNITIDSGQELVSLTSNGGMNIQGSYELKDISIALVEPVKTIPYSLQATKSFTYAVLGEEMATDDITVTCIYNTNAKNNITNYESNIDELIESQTYGDKTVNVYYTENEKTVTTTFDIHFFEKKLEDPQPFIPMKAFDWYDAWKYGINIGNTLDPYLNSTNYNGLGDNIWSSKGDEMMCNSNPRMVQETRWFQPKIVEQDIKNIKDAGFDMVRIPITWIVNGYKDSDGHLHIGKYFTYRVREIINWCQKYGLYVLINTHHDSKMLFDLGVSETKLNTKLQWAKEIWTEIAEELKNYDQTVAFEGFNELDNLESSWTPSEKAQLQMNRMNQVFVDAVRSTGGNNSRRVLVCPVLIHNGQAVTYNNFTVPNDEEEGYIGTAIHWYTDNYIQGVDSLFKFHESNADKLGIPLMVNEFGYKDLSYSPENSDILAKLYQNYVARARHFNVAPVIWDNGSNHTIFVKETDSLDSDGKSMLSKRPSVYPDKEITKKYQEHLAQGGIGYAWRVPDEKYKSYTTEVNDWYLGTLNCSTGEASNNSWNGKVSPFIEVSSDNGESVSIVYTKNSDLASTHKSQIITVVYYDENKDYISGKDLAYMSIVYSATIPDGAKYMRFCIFSKHDSISQDDFVEMFKEDIIEVMNYADDDVYEIKLPERVPVQLDVLDIKTEYQIGEEFDSSIKAKVLYDDGQYVSVRKGLTIDTSSINIDTKGKYQVTISYENGGVTITSIKTIVYGIWIRSLVLYDEDIISIKLGEVNNNTIANYLNPNLVYTDDTKVSISIEDLSIDTSEVNFSAIGKYNISASYNDTDEGIITSSIILDLYKWEVYKESTVEYSEYTNWIEEYIQACTTADSWAIKGIDTIKEYYASGDITAVRADNTVYFMQGKCWYDDTNIYSEYPIVCIYNMTKGIMQSVVISSQYNAIISTKDDTDTYYYAQIANINECVNDIYHISDISEI